MDNIKNPYDKEDGNYIEFEQIINNFPKEFIDGKNKIALYVGASCSRAFLLDLLWSLGYEVDIIEIWEKNLDCIKKDYRFRNLIHGDVANESIYGNYDVIFWYHGPEHVLEEQFKLIDEIFEKKAKLIILGCPFENLSQGALDGNENERHVWSINVESLHKYGYITSQIARNGVSDNIVAWKII